MMPVQRILCASIIAIALTLAASSVEGHPVAFATGIHDFSSSVGGGFSGGGGGGGGGGGW